MTRVLITAFEPYDRWTDNSSWAALMELTSWYDGEADVTTRRYPVDLAAMSTALRSDAAAGYDLALHLGQSPASPIVKLESVGLNVRTDSSPLIADAAEAYRSPLPLGGLATTLCKRGIPAELSLHAGTYLCNAALYLSQHYAHTLATETRAAFIHLPLTPGQAARFPNERLPSMSSTLCAAAIAIAIEELAM